MHLPRNILVVSTLSVLSAGAAFGGVTVSSPGNGSEVSSPFALSATAVTCSSQTISAMGYSLDNSSDTTIVKSTSVEANVAASLGSHTLHVKAWGQKGAVCVTDVAIQVIASGPEIPADAISVSSIQALSNWELQHDPKTNGNSSGLTTLVSSPSHTGTARQFVTSYVNAGGQLYHASFGDDTEATNFLYDGWVYLTSSASAIANLEMDMNQVMANGQTVIYGFQCDGYSGTWDYSANTGTPQNPVGHWVHAQAACNVRNWAVSVWHHVQISYSRTASGVVTYKSVWLDGKAQTINGTAASAYALGWSPVLLTNFQVDGLGTSGTATVYLDDLTVYRW